MNPSDRLIKQFRDLVTVRLERINRALMELESGANLEAGRGVLRELHGLKGEARMMGFDDINALVHEMEELVRCTEPHRYTLTPASADALLLAADAVLLLSGALPSADPPPEVDTLVASLQACIRAEADRIPSLVLKPIPASAPGGGVAPHAGSQGPGGTAGTSGTPANVSSAPPGWVAAAGASGAQSHTASTPPGPGGTAGASGILGRGGLEGPGEAGLPGGFDVSARDAQGTPGVGGPTVDVPWAAPEAARGASGATGPARAVPPTGAGPRGWPSAPRNEVDATGASRASTSVTATAAVALGRMPSPGASGARAPAGPPAATRQPEPRSDTAVRIGVASLDLMTSAVTNSAGSRKP